MSTKPTTATPRPKPSARPITIEDAARKRRERNLDQAIAEVQPILARSEAYFRMLGVDPVALAISPKAMSTWSGGRMAPMNVMPRKWIL